MSPLHGARSIFSVLFLAVLFTLSAVNAYINGSPLWDALSGVGRSLNLERVVFASRRGVRVAAENFIGRHHAAAVRSRMLAALGKREVENFTVIKGSDGRLYRGGLFPVDPAPAMALADSMTFFAQLAAEAGTKVLYVAAPDTVPPGSYHLPSRLPVLNYNGAIDTLLYRLWQNGVATADSRYAFLTRNFPRGEITARTGPLLTAPAAFALFSVVVDAVNDELGTGFGQNSPYTEYGSYRKSVHPDFFIGSLGQITGPAFSGLDDFTALYPDFPTAFSIAGMDTFQGEFTATGPAETTLLNTDVIISPAPLYNFYPQSFYRHSNLSWSRVQNLQRAAGPRVLLIHDFYTAQLASLLAPLCGELHTLSYQTATTENAMEYIRDNPVDVVVISLFPANLLSSDLRLLFSPARRNHVVAADATHASPATEEQ